MRYFSGRLPSFQKAGLSMKQNKKGSSVKSCPLSALRGETDNCPARLREHVTERCQDHVFDGLGRNAGVRRIVVVARPAGLGDVGVLDAPANAAFGTLVNLVPKADAAFKNVADVAGTSTSAPGRGASGGRGFGGATGVVGKRRTVASNFRVGSGMGCDRRRG